MEYENVDVVVKDSLIGDPVEDAVVRVYSKDGKNFFTQEVTDVDGRAAFLLFPQEYQLRFYKRFVSFKNPLYINVLSVPVPPDSNIFDLTADLLTPPIAVDPRFCKAFGHFIRPDGKPAAYVDVHIITRFKPLLLEGNAVVTERVITRTDEAGYMEVDLIRFGKYDVTVQGIEDHQRCITVPDAPNVNLPSLLFPVVSRVTFDPPGPFAVLADQELAVVVKVFSSDGNEVNLQDVYWTSSDTGVASIGIGGDTITIRGVVAGLANLQGDRVDQSIVRIPNTPIEGLPIEIAVT